jgi:hypothetical protein
VEGLGCVTVLIKGRGGVAALRRLATLKIKGVGRGGPPCSAVSTAKGQEFSPGVVCVCSYARLL